jgi:hypothetical protein
VGLSVSDPALGLLSTVDDLTVQAASLTLSTVAGNASAVFHTQNSTGNVNVTAAAFDTVANRNVSAFTSFSIAQGPELERISLEAVRSSIPANQFGVEPFLGSPYLTEITITYLDADGTLAEPTDGMLGVSVDPVTLGAFSTLDDPETEDVNEFFVLIGNGPVDVAAGKATIFVHSFGSPGSVRVSVTGTDAGTGDAFDGSFDVQIVEPASDGRPANIQIVQSDQPQYVQGAGGNVAKSFQFILTDGAGELIDDPAGVNNLTLELFSDSGDNGEFLSATAVNGNEVQGRTIAVSTTAGVTGANLTSGTVPGIMRVRATSDIVDNDVSNGIQGPVSSEVPIVISDGIPFSVTLSQIPVNSLIVNPVASPIVGDANPTDGIPPEPNATYSLNVGAIVTDRFGNPPAQPIQLQFGLIDSPLDGYPALGSGVFSMSGLDGDPEEGGTGFFAPSGEFRTGGGGAGPNDTLILFGKDVEGNDDHESARTVNRVIDQTNLIVDETFNLNDFTGRSVDSGPALPYVVGRALVGNIESGALTDENGVGNTRINYPVSAIGRTNAIYVQSSNGGLGAQGDIATLGDAAIIRYPGLAPLSVTANPGIIQGNTTVNVLVCVEDAAEVPIVGQFVVFAFSGGDALGSVDGVPGSGITGSPTGFDGCTIASVSTSGVLVDAGGDFKVIFSVGEATAEVMITSPSAAILQAVPSAVLGNTTSTTITLTYISGGGEPVADIQLTGDCEVESGTGLITILDPPGLTDVNGQTTVRLSAAVDAFVCPGETETGAMGFCEFTTAAGDPTVQVPVIGRTVDLSAFSPSPCP